MKKLLIIIAILLTPVLGLGADWQVTQADPVGACDTNDYACSVTEFNALSGDYGGDTFYFSGTITSEIAPNIYGTAWGANTQVTLDGYEADNTTYQDLSEVTGPTHRAKVDRGGGSNNGIVLDNTNELKYILIADFEITDCNVAIVVRGTDNGGGDTNNIKIQRNYMYECGNQGVYLGRECSYITIGGSAGNGNVVKNVGVDTAGADVTTCASDDVIVSYNHLYADNTNWGVDGITFDCTAPNRWLIEYNSIHSHNHINGEGENGIDIKKDTTDVIIRFNDIYDHQTANYAEIILNGNTTEACSNIYIYGNRIHDGICHGIDMQGSTGPDYDNIYIWSNLIYGMDDRGISGARAGTFYVYNNTLHSNGEDPENTTVTNLWQNRTVLTAKNNIFSEGRPNETDEIQVYMGTSADTGQTFDRNTYYHTGGSSIVFWGDDGNNTIAQLATMGAPYGNQEVNGNDANPGFTNAAGDDFTLDGTHINNGVDLGGTTDWSVTVQGVIYYMGPAIGLDPNNTNWSTTPPTVATLDQDDNGSWERGAYVYPVSTQTVKGMTIK